MTRYSSDYFSILIPVEPNLSSPHYFLILSSQKGCYSGSRFSEIQFFSASAP
jgi:hypothetical protein